MITYTFLPDKGILETTWEGDITVDQILKYISENKGNKEYPEKFKIITYAQKANLLLTPEDLRAIAKVNNEAHTENETTIDAFVATDAQAAALSTLYEKFSRMPTYKFKVFSTPEAAMEWLERM